MGAMVMRGGEVGGELGDDDRRREMMTEGGDIRRTETMSPGWAPRAAAVLRCAALCTTLSTWCMQTPVRAACDEGMHLSIYPLRTSQCVVDAGHRAVLQRVAAVDRTDAAVGETGQIVHVSQYVDLASP